MIKDIIKIILYLILWLISLMFKPFKVALVLDIEYKSVDDDKKKLEKLRTIKIENKRKKFLELCFKTYLYKEN